MENNMNKTLSLLKRGFESSSSKTPEFTAFTRTFKSEFKKVLKELNCTELECINGHFDISGFFNSANGQLWYFNIGDVRWGQRNSLLIRTAQHRKDYTGGPNMYAGLEYLIPELKRIIQQYDNN